MKTIFKIMALALFATALMSAVAQDNANVFRANIPFSFYAGGKLMPAGEYKIAVNLTDRVVTIGDRATGHRFMLLGSPDDSSRGDRTVLTFKLTGDEVYALRELQGPDLGLSFRASGSQHAMSAQSEKPESVQVVARVW